MRRFIVIALILAAVRVAGAEPIPIPDALQQLAVQSEAVVVARVGSVSASPHEHGGAYALWIVRSLKGRLRGGRDIVWIYHKDLPGAEIGNQLWLLFLSRDEQAVWTTLKGANDEGLVKLPDPQAPVLGAAAQFIGKHGEPPDFPDLVLEGDSRPLLEQAGNSNRTSSREALAKLAAQGPDIVPFIRAAEAGEERSISAAARMLLPLVTAGPPVNGMRLGLQPAQPEKIELHDGEKRAVTVNFCNVTLTDITLATGATLSGEAVRAVTAFDVFKTDSKQQPAGGPLAGVLTAAVEAMAENPKSATMPIIHRATPLAAFGVDVQLSLDCGNTPGKTPMRLRLYFPQGYVELPGFGAYLLRAHFDCPGPRPDQQRLVNENFWGGGQLVSNDILVIVAPPRASEVER